MEEKVLGVLVALLPIFVFLLFIAISWMATCLIVHFIGWCFGFDISLLTATGIWVILWMVKGLLNSANNN